MFEEKTGGPRPELIGSERPLASDTNDRLVPDGGAGPPENDDERQSTSMTESAGGASEEEIGFVLDEIHENTTGLDMDTESAEYLVFENTGDRPLDLSGWTVENEAGRTYRFPEGFVAEPGDRITLHSGHGEDTESELHWGSDEAVWEESGDTVTVRTKSGRVMVSEPYNR